MGVESKNAIVVESKGSESHETPQSIANAVDEIMLKMKQGQVFQPKQNNNNNDGKGTSVTVCVCLYEVNETVLY